MASRRARIAFWVGVALVVFVLAILAAITFSSGGSEYGGGTGGY
jgi:ABC-type transporter Mla subunit MlaD